MLEEKIIRKQKEIHSIRDEKAIAYELSGDGWHDNPGFNRLMQLEERAVNELHNLEQYIADAIVVPIYPRNTVFVTIGSIVQYRSVFTGSGELTEKIIEIVGSGETNISENKISYDSPFGSNLLGMGIGEKKTFRIPKGEVTFHVLALLPELSSIVNTPTQKEDSKA